MENETCTSNALFSIPLEFSADQFLQYSKIIIEDINNPKFFINFRDKFFARVNLQLLWYVNKIDGHYLISFNASEKNFRIKLNIFWNDYDFTDWGFTNIAENCYVWESAPGNYWELMIRNKMLYG